jgi:hypothetical protein
MKNKIWLVLLVVSACNPKNQEEKLKNFVESRSHKITQSITVGDVAIVSRFLPQAYRLLMGRSGDSMVSEGDRFFYFDVKFSKNGNFRPEKEKLLYLNFDMGNNFVLFVNNRDSIAPVFCQKIESGISKEYEYMVVFEKKTDEKWRDFTLIYNDKIFSMGTVAFVYNEKDILKIPGIKEKELK